LAAPRHANHPVPHPPPCTIFLVQVWSKAGRAASAAACTPSSPATLRQTRLHCWAATRCCWTGSRARCARVSKSVCIFV